MGDYYSDQKKQEGLWETARRYINIYYGHTESETIDKEHIKYWCKSYKWTPKELAEELNIDTDGQ
jgi:hypothetical protein